VYYVLRGLLSIPRFKREATVVYMYEEAVVYLVLSLGYPRSMIALASEECLFTS
jgi:hypothetical protein